VVEAIVGAAFARYIPRIGRRPAPMDDDYAARARAGQLFVAVGGDGGTVGMVVLISRERHLLIDVLAVDPGHHGTGVGQALLAFAEERARAQGRNELQLYTNAAMTENLVFYPRRGFLQTARETVNGFQRVFFVKRLD
jgi:GNAT superfamily N-acetyltransferase